MLATLMVNLESTLAPLASVDIIKGVSLQLLHDCVDMGGEDNKVAVTILNELFIERFLDV